ncbi:MAG: hypothetical protein ACI33M_13810 [Lysinibacillus sp.]
MGKGRMLLVSGIISICFAAIVIVALLFISEDNPLKKLLDKPAENANAATEQPSEEEVHIEDSYVGIRTITDELGVHDILFESGTVAHTATSGPIQLTVTDVRLEQLTPANDKIKTALEERDPSTVAILKVVIENNGAQPVIFNIDDAKIVADSNEKVVLNPKLSTVFGSNFQANETKQGTLIIDFQSKPRDIASIQLKVATAYDKNYDEIGDPIILKIPMY